MKQCCFWEPEHVGFCGGCMCLASCVIVGLPGVGSCLCSRCFLMFFVWAAMRHVNSRRRRWMSYTYPLHVAVEQHLRLKASMPFMTFQGDGEDFRVCIGSWFVFGCTQLYIWCLEVNVLLGLRSGTYADQVVQSHLRRATCIEQLSQNHLRRPICTQPVAPSNFLRITCAN